MYIEWVAKTSRIKLEGEIIQVKDQEAILGFWHGDSFGMNFLLRAMKGSAVKADVIITADKRGNYIEQLIKGYGGAVLRMPDGMAMRSFFKALKEASKQPGRTVCVALDGPLGPYHEPKKLGATLSLEGNKPYILVKVDYKYKINLNKRWDRYAIPLPFGEMTFTGYNLGVINKSQINEFTLYKQVIQKTMS